jgi:hypothetical protein
MTTVTLHFLLPLLSLLSLLLLLLLGRLVRFQPRIELIAGSVSRIITAECSGKLLLRRPRDGLWNVAFTSCEPEIKGRN